MFGMGKYWKFSLSPNGINPFKTKKTSNVNVTPKTKRKVSPKGMMPEPERIAKPKKPVLPTYIPVDTYLFVSVEEGERAIQELIEMIGMIKKEDIVAKVENLKRIEVITDKINYINKRLININVARENSTGISFYHKSYSGSNESDLTINHKASGCSTMRFLANNLLNFNAHELRGEKEKLIKELSEL